MVITPENNEIINKYVKALKENNAVVFAGAGLSIKSGFFDWNQLLKPMAESLGLDISENQDLTALAQYYVDDKGGRGDLNQILVDHYNNLDIKISESHRILSRLPIQIYWTTNFDNLIEQALMESGKTPDVKRTQANLSENLPKRDAIVYKMHGDIGLASDTVLTKHEYEDYNISRQLFSNAFIADFISRTFLFIGFSFTDPNLDYLISRIRSTVGSNKRPDYYFLKKEQDPKAYHRQKIRANSLKQYGLYAIWVEDYDEIEIILKEIEIRYLRNSVFISGSADIYDPFSRDDAVKFLHDLSSELSKNELKIVTGFGLGVGSAIINGVLENMENKRNKNLDYYILMRPFPQYPTGGKDLKQLWTEYRNRFIPLAGIAIFVFGNKNEGKDLAGGMQEEFDIAIEKGLKVIPIGATGYISEILLNNVISSFKTYYPENTQLLPLFKSLNDKGISLNEHISTTVKIINNLNNN